MSVPVENSKDIRLGDGQTTVWPFSFVVTDKSQIHVIRVKPDKTQIKLPAGSFEVLIKDSGVGGSIEYPVLEGDNDVLKEGEKIIIYRETDLLSDFAPKNGETFDPVSIMKAVDKLTLQNQEQAEALNRSVKTDMTEDISPDDVLDSIKNSEAVSIESAILARAWAIGDDEEVPEPGEHSSKGNAGLAFAIANADEDVPIPDFSMPAAAMIKGEKGDPGPQLEECLAAIEEKGGAVLAAIDEAQTRADASVNVVKEYKDVVVSSALEATNQTVIASEKAATAVDCAMSAGVSSSNAALSESNAATSAANAMTQANIATDQASNAGVSAANAAVSEACALSYKNAAEGSATTATTKAGEASASATQAATFADNAANSATSAETQAAVATSKATEATQQAQRAQNISNEFEENATEKTNTYNTNAQEKLSTYNANHTQKCEAYNANAVEKLNAITNEGNTQVNLVRSEGAEQTNEARAWAIGDDDEVPVVGEHSAKGNAGLAYAFANADEDVPVDEFECVYAKRIETLATSGTIALAANKIYKIAPTGAITFVLPTIADESVYSSIIIQAYFEQVVDVSFGVNAGQYFNGQEPFVQTGYVNYIYEYDSNAGAWYIGSVVKG